MTTDPLPSLSFMSLPAHSGALYVPPGICLRVLVWNCGERTVGRGHSTSGECVVPAPEVAAVAVLVMAVLSVVAVPAVGGGRGCSNGGGIVCALAVAVAAVVDGGRVCVLCWCCWRGTFT